MIRIYKSAFIPAILSNNGIAKTNALKVEYILDPTRYTSAPGVGNSTLTRMEFDSTIYGDSTVKQQLIADQHEKCCFCESKFLDNSYGDVEHFRPKAAYKKLGARGLTYPGYYWLAYDWSNLMFSCEKCNRSYKRNLFPLQNELTRKPFHNHPNILDNEDSLLINPNLENPAIFIYFKEEVPIPVAGNLRGKKTIEAFQLERLNNSRLEYLNELDLALTLVRIDAGNNIEIEFAMHIFKFSRKEVLEFINRASLLYNSVAKDTAKYAQCVRNKFPHLPII